MDAPIPYDLPVTLLAAVNRCTHMFVFTVLYDILYTSDMITIDSGTGYYKSMILLWCNLLFIKKPNLVHNHTSLTQWHIVQGELNVGTVRPLFSQEGVRVGGGRSCIAMQTADSRYDM